MSNVIRDNVIYPDGMKTATFAIENCQIEHHDGYILIRPLPGHRLDGGIKCCRLVSAGGEGLMVGLAGTGEEPSDGLLRVWESAAEETA